MTLRHEPDLAATSDTEHVCCDCYRVYTLTANEHRWYADMGFLPLPRRCIDCRKAKRARYEASGPRA